MIKKILKIIAVLIFVGFIVIQFFRPDFSNPPIIEAETLEASTAIPENVSAILNRSCKDCHSNETVYPLYSNVAPVSWWLAEHIGDAQREMNFSVWNTYETRRKERKLEEICEQIQAKAMPLPSYLWAHWDAQLSDEDIKILCEWAEREKAKIIETK